jgi:mono/diheme cytochrome c family protein
MFIAFIIFWILVALAVFFVAIFGSSSRAGESAGSESRLAQRAVTITVIIVCAAGLAIPALVLASNAEHKASAAIGGVHLNGQEQKGRELFAHTCVVCHTLAAVKSVGQIGPNLDIRVGDDIPTVEGRRALVLSAITEGRARGLGNMPAGLYVGKEAEDVADFVAAVAGH